MKHTEAGLTIRHRADSKSDNQPACRHRAGSGREIYSNVITDIQLNIDFSRKCAKLNIANYGLKLYIILAYASEKQVISGISVARQRLGGKRCFRKCPSTDGCLPLRCARM
ncbi:MAG: hypothetical protein IJ776_10040 [Paludibacteraceae bacterium]|nr:hypothetical protein [Paludibacteraceae bacterium]